MKISEKQIILLLNMFKDSLDYLTIMGKNEHNELISKTYNAGTDFLNEIINQQSDELREVE